MKTRLEQIEKQIRLWKTLDINQIIWETTIDNITISKLKEKGYSVAQEHFGRFYVINW